jgi:hypothetical protein
MAIELDASVTAIGAWRTSAGIVTLLVSGRVIVPPAGPMVTVELLIVPAIRTVVEADLEESSVLTAEMVTIYADGTVEGA